MSGSKETDDLTKTTDSSAIRINVYENEKSLCVLNRTEKIVRNKKAFKGMKATQKKHHTGPIKTQFIEDSLGRAKTKRVRKATLFKKAKELYSTTNLDVAVMVLDNKKIDSFFTPDGLLENNIFKNLTKIMPNTTTKAIQIAASPSSNDEVEMSNSNCEAAEEATVSIMCESEAQYEVQDVGDYDREKCSICYVKFESKLDCIPSPYLNYALLKCQRGLCDYHVHSYCIGLGLEDEKTVRSLKFLCPKHTLDV